MYFASVPVRVVNVAEEKRKVVAVVGEMRAFKFGLWSGGSELCGKMEFFQIVLCYATHQRLLSVGWAMLSPVHPSPSA